MKSIYLKRPAEGDIPAIKKQVDILVENGFYLMSIAKWQFMIVYYSPDRMKADKDAKRDQVILAALKELSSLTKTVIRTFADNTPEFEISIERLTTEMSIL